MTTDIFTKWIQDKVIEDDKNGLRNGLQNIAGLSSAESDKIVKGVYKWYDEIQVAGTAKKEIVIAATICVNLDVTNNKDIRQFKKFKIVLL